MPMGPYKDFEDCLRSTSHRKDPPSDPSAYCGWLKNKIEGTDPFFAELYASNKLDEIYGYYRLELMASRLNLMDREKAQRALSGEQVWKNDPDAVVLDDHRWLHMWANTLKSGNNLFITRKQLKELHDLVIDEFMRRQLDSGISHKTPMNVGPLELSPPAKRLAYLVNARYEEASPLACCDAPWIACAPWVSSGSWSYLPNVPESRVKLKELGIDTIVGTRMTPELLEGWTNGGFQFELRTSDVVEAPQELADFSLPDEVEIDLAPMRLFLDSVRDKTSYQCMKLGCGSMVPLKLKLDTASALTSPDEKKKWKYVAQLHIRGLNAHGDLRMQVGPDQLIGWTVDVGKSLVKAMLRRVPEAMLTPTGISKEDLGSLSVAELSSKLDGTPEGRKLKSELSQKTQKMSVAQLTEIADEVWAEEAEPAINASEKIYTQAKASMPVSWLTREGEVPAGEVGATSELEGQLIIMDKGEVEFGAQKPYFHEYWLHGSRLNCRAVMRRVPTRKEWGTKDAFAWLTFFTKKNEAPYSLSSRAAAKKWYPPRGVSALPKAIRLQIPSEYQYWTSKDPAATRDELVKALGEKKVPLKLSSGLKFALKRVRHKKKPLTRCWALLHNGEKVFDAWDFGEADPFSQNGVTVRRVGGSSAQGMLSSLFETVDEGSAKILTDGADRLQLSLEGKTLQGAYIFLEQDKGSWVFQKTELPEQLKALHLSESWGPVLKCAVEDNSQVEVKEQGGLLIITGPAIKPGEVIPMDGRPTFFTAEGIVKFWPSMMRQPVVILHGELKGDVVGFVNKNWVDAQGWGWAESVIWHPLAIKMILEKKLPAYSIEVLPETVWDAEHQHDHVVGGRCIGLSVVPKGACPTCNPTEARIGTVANLDQKVYKFGLSMKDYLIDRYYTQGLSTEKIAKNEGIPRSTLEGWMDRLKIPRRALKDARRLRSQKESGRAVITALGTGSMYRDVKGEPRGIASTLFSVGSEHLLVNAPKGIMNMLALKKAHPRYVFLEAFDSESAAGLHQLRSIKPLTVFATRDGWEKLRESYSELSGEKGLFEDIYAMDRRVLLPGKVVNFGSFTVKPILLSDSTLGYQIGIAGKMILHCSNVKEIPGGAVLLKDVDIYIGDGTSLKDDVDDHASMVKQLQWAKDADVSKVFFTKIGSSEGTEVLNKLLQDVAPNAQVFSDGSELAIGGGNPMSQLSKALAKGILDGSVEALVRDKPYTEYSKQAILFGYEDKILGLYVEGYPVEMTLEELSKLKLGVDPKKLNAPFWVYKPRVLKQFDPVRVLASADVVGHPYIHEAELVENGDDG